MADLKVAQKMSDPKYKNLSSIQYASAGAFSGFITRFTCQPLDVLKILFQLQVDPKNCSKYSSIIQSVSVIVREEGIAALWKGHIPAQWLSIAYGAIQFSTYERILKYGSIYLEENNYKNSFIGKGLHFYAGCASGVIAITLSFPFDTIRTRLVAQKKSKLYNGMYDAGRQIWILEGPNAFFKGLVPACIQIGPAAGLVFGFKNIYTKIWNKWTAGFPDSDRVTASGHLLTGLLSGVTSKAVVHPMDVIKKRLQIQGMDKNSMVLKIKKYNGLMNCLIMTLKCEGFLALYKGITPAIIKSGAATSINFAVYNETCGFLDYISR